MAIIATDSGGGGDFKPVPPGNHRAVCTMVVDLGRQRITSRMFGESIKHQVYVAWEIPDETIEWEKDGEAFTGPMRIGKTYTVSLHENANLRRDLESWRGRPFTEEEKEGFDITKLAGIPALINVTHEKSAGNGKAYANVSAVTPLPKGMEKPSPSGSVLVYDADNVAAFDQLSEYFQKKIQSQVTDDNEPHNPDGGGQYDDDLDDSVPF